MFKPFANSIYAIAHDNGDFAEQFCEILNIVGEKHNYVLDETKATFDNNASGNSQPPKPMQEELRNFSIGHEPPLYVLHVQSPIEPDDQAGVASFLTKVEDSVKNVFVEIIEKQKSLNLGHFHHCVT